MQEHLRKEFYYIFEQSDYPGVPRLDFRTIDQAPFWVGGIELLPIPVMHRGYAGFGFSLWGFCLCNGRKLHPPKLNGAVARRENYGTECFAQKAPSFSLYP